MVRRCGALLMLVVVALLGAAVAIADTGPPVTVAAVEAGTDAVQTDFDGTILNIAVLTGEEVKGALALGTNAALSAAGWPTSLESTGTAHARQGDRITELDAQRRADTASHRILRPHDIERGYRLVVV